MYIAAIAHSLFQIDMNIDVFTNYLLPDQKRFCPMLYSPDN
jgi:hypothetical protein